MYTCFYLYTNLNLYKHKFYYLILREVNQRHQQSVNVLQDTSYTSYAYIYIFFEFNINECLNFLQNKLPALLKNVLTKISVGMWLYHEKAPPHYSTAVRDYMDITYPGRYWKRNDPLRWPPRPLAPTYFDFYLYGCVREIVYTTGTLLYNS